MSESFELGGRAQQNGIVRKGDEGLWVKFYAHSVHNPYRSQEEGRPVYEKKDFIEIRQPGERDSINRPAQDGDKWRFERHWAAYQAQQDQNADGTPMAILFPADPHVVDMMRAINIFTVEQLANIKDVGLQRLGMGGRDKVKRAQDFLSAASANKGSNHLQAQNDEMRDRIAVLEAQLKQVLGSDVALDAPLRKPVGSAPTTGPKKRGRPARAASETPAASGPEEE